MTITKLLHLPLDKLHVVTHDDLHTHKQPCLRSRCLRCKAELRYGVKVCVECGLLRGRRVRGMRRRKPIGGKRGRNSGHVSSHGKST